MYFEWNFRRLPQIGNKTGFAVGLHFEMKNNDAENERLLNLFRPSIKSLEDRLGAKVEFDDNWPRGDDLWTRLYVWTPQTDMSADLQNWAVEKAKILIQECEPILLGVAPDEAPPAPEAADLDSLSPERAETTIHRIIRDTELARRVKAIHSYRCQVCGHSIQLPNGSFYAEAHHLKPLGRPHDGPDKIGNIVCLCPNHHAEFDYGVVQIKHSELVAAEGHAVSAKFIEYHNMSICRNP